MSLGGAGGTPCVVGGGVIDVLHVLPPFLFGSALRSRLALKPENRAPEGATAGFRAEATGHDSRGFEGEHYRAGRRSRSGVSRMRRSPEPAGVSRCRRSAAKPAKPAAVERFEGRAALKG